jgi:fatty acid desaturase
VNRIYRRHFLLFFTIASFFPQLIVWLSLIFVSITMTYSLKTAFITATTALLVLSTAPVTAQWAPTSGPFGGVLQVLRAAGSGIFAGTSGGGVFRSTDSEKQRAIQRSSIYY